MDGELVFRINSKTIKKVNVTLGPPIKPQPAEKREPMDTNPAPSEEVDVDNNQSVEELSDNEAAEKENIENFEGTSQKAETARARVANKVKIIRVLQSRKAKKIFIYSHVFRQEIQAFLPETWSIAIFNAIVIAFSK